MTKNVRDFIRCERFRFLVRPGRTSQVSSQPPLLTGERRTFRSNGHREKKVNEWKYEKGPRRDKDWKYPGYESRRSRREVRVESGSGLGG